MIPDSFTCLPEVRYQEFNDTRFIYLFTRSQISGIQWYQIHLFVYQKSDIRNSMMPDSFTCLPEVRYQEFNDARFIYLFTRSQIWGILKMKNKRSHTVGTKCNTTILERGKIDTPSTQYMTAQFPGLVQALQ